MTRHPYYSRQWRDWVVPGGCFVVLITLVLIATEVIRVGG